MFIFGTKSHKHENRLRALEELFKRVIVTSICALAACRDGSMDIALVVLEYSVPGVCQCFRMCPDQENPISY